MAESNSHKLGQIIGAALEAAISPQLEVFAKTYGLYLDKKGTRLCRSSRKVSWTDINKNVHDLDFVLERGGTDEKLGIPVAFIETAWRRYTKHSRAKAQEIQGAIEPLFQKYRQSAPFKGALLAGVFTQGALTQLKSLGFKIVFVDYDMVIKAFATQGINVSFEEDTSEKELAKKVAMCHALSADQRVMIGLEMLKPYSNQLGEFFQGLKEAVQRKVIAVRILALFGSLIQVTSVEDAVALVNSFDEDASKAKFNRYEIRLEFSNGDYIEGQFQSKTDAIDFLCKAKG